MYGTHATEVSFRDGIHQDVDAGNTVVLPPYTTDFKNKAATRSMQDVLEEGGHVQLSSASGLVASHQDTQAQGMTVSGRACSGKSKPGSLYAWVGEDTSSSGKTGHGGVGAAHVANMHERDESAVRDDLFEMPGPPMHAMNVAVASCCDDPSKALQLGGRIGVDPNRMLPNASVGPADISSSKRGVKPEQRCGREMDTAAFRRTHAQLDHFCADDLFLGKFVMLGRKQRRTGGIALLARRKVLCHWAVQVLSTAFLSF